MRKQKTRSILSAFENVPTEMYFKIFAYLDLQSVQTARCVSKFWKLIAEESRHLYFTCDLTDETVTTIINSQEIFHSVRIHDFEGRGSRVVSATRGTGRILSCAEFVQMTGTNINPIEIKKMIKYAVGSVKELSFQSCHMSTLQAVFVNQNPFESLRKLSMEYKSFPTYWDTNILETLSCSTLGPTLPSLEHFRISYSMDMEQMGHINHLQIPINTPRAKDIFANYLAICRVILRFKATLKHVEILRNEIIRTAMILRINTVHVVISQRQRHYIQQCVEGFQDMELDSLHVTPILDEGDFPWTLESSLVRNQQQLKEITYDKKLCFPRAGSQVLRNIFPPNVNSFTIVKLAITCMDHEPVDLMLFSQCMGLKTLWLVFFRGVQLGPAGQNTLNFVNLEHLPKSITSLHFKSSQTEPIVIHQQSILSRPQLHWIIDNLQELESFWIQLVMREQNLLHDVLPVLVGDENENLEGVRNLINQINEEINQVANIDAQTFRDIICMPKLKDIKLDMLKSGQLGGILHIGEDGNPWVVPGGRISHEDIREYVEIIEQTPDITLTQEQVSFFPFRFIELSIVKKVR